MSNECDECGQNAGMYGCDHSAARIVTECLHVMRNYCTVTKLTACYNLTERILRLFAVQGAKEDVTKLIDTFHEQIKQCVEEYYER